MELKDITKDTEQWATRCTKAPAYAGSGKGSHHLVYCTQPYLVFYTRGCFQDLNPWPSSHMTTTLPVAPRLPLQKIQNNNSENIISQNTDYINNHTQFHTTFPDMISHLFCNFVLKKKLRFILQLTPRPHSSYLEFTHLLPRWPPLSSEREQLESGYYIFLTQLPLLI